MIHALMYAKILTIAVIVAALAVFAIPMSIQPAHAHFDGGIECIRTPCPGPDCKYGCGDEDASNAHDGSSKYPRCSDDQRLCD